MYETKLNDFVTIKGRGKHLPTVISFSSVNTPPGQFKPYRIVDTSTVNIIFVNDNGNRWYQCGIEGIANNSEDAAKELISKGKEIGNGRVVTFGTSMGAFGAMLFAALGHADGCIAFGVEAHLGFEGSRSKLYQQQKALFPYKDLKPVLRNNRIPMYLFASETDEIDLISLYHLRDIPNLTMNTICGMDHPGVQVFDLDNSIGTLINEFALTGKVADHFERKGDILSSPQLIAELFEAFKLKTVEKDMKKWLNYMNEMEKHWSDNSTVMLRLGEARYKYRNVNGAENAWRKAIELNPYSTEAYSKLGALIRRKGALNEALVLLQKSVLINPFNAHAFHTIGLVNNDLGNLEEAEKSFRKSVSINPGNKDFKKSLASCLLKQAELKIAESQKLFATI